jgi:ketosteroid isomerase-like protein/quercetin dioxygenase-like cupin family protein
MTRPWPVLGAALALVPPASFAQEPVQGSFAITWEEIQARPAGASGRSREFLRLPTATLDRLQMHVTWLPAGQTTHAPHTHPNEEVIVVREGTLDAFQNGKTTRVGPGSVLFMGSNEPHNVVNVGDTTAVYHVINWHSPGMLKPQAEASPRDAVQAFYRDWSAAALARGAEGYASFFAEDAMLLPPDAVPVAGRAAIREWQERQQKDATHQTVPEAISEDELTVSGGVVLYRSTLKGTRIAKAGGAPEPIENKYLDVLRRKPDGRYEFVRRMWSSNLAQSAR